MEEEKMLVPSGLKTVDGKDIMCYTGAFYLKNEEKIKRIIKIFENNAANFLKSFSKSFFLPVMDWVMSPPEFIRWSTNPWCNYSGTGPLGDN